MLLSLRQRVMHGLGRADEFSINLAQQITRHIPVVWSVILIVQHEIRSYIQI
jgi:hypothetical protein